MGTKKYIPKPKIKTKTHKIARYQASGKIKRRLTREQVYAKVEKARKTMSPAKVERLDGILKLARSGQEKKGVIKKMKRPVDSNGIRLKNDIGMKGPRYNVKFGQKTKIRNIKAMAMMGALLTIGYISKKIYDTYKSNSKGKWITSKGRKFFIKG